MRTILLFCALCILTSINAQKFEPKWVGQVVALSVDQDITTKMTEKASVQIKTKQSAGRLLVGIEPVRQKAYIKGNASP